MGLNDYIKIGDSIRKLRLKQGWTQAQMAEKLGVAKSTYANYENNHREPSGEVLRSILNIFNVTMIELILEKEDWHIKGINPIDFGDENSPMFEKYIDLTPSEKDKVESFNDYMVDFMRSYLNSLSSSDRKEFLKEIGYNKEK